MFKPEHLAMCRNETCLFQADVDISFYCPVCRPGDYTNRLTPTTGYAAHYDREPWAR